MVFFVYNKTLGLSNLKTRTAMNAEISVFVVCVEAIRYLSLHNWHNCTPKDPSVFKNFPLLMFFKKNILQNHPSQCYFTNLQNS